MPIVGFGPYLDYVDLFFNVNLVLDMFSIDFVLFKLIVLFTDY